MRTARMYFWTVRLLTRMPSLSSYPRILSAPQSLFAEAIDWISVAVSVARRDAGRVRLRRRQRALKPARCQRRSVSGWTMRRTFLHVGVKAARATRTIRSNRATRGLATER